MAEPTPELNSYLF